jgi:signal transduction histidine kinase
MRSVNSHFKSDILRSERLRLVGAMANSILHDLKNPVCLARCCSDLIASETGDQGVRKFATMLGGAVNGLLSTTQDLFDYTRDCIFLDKQRISIWRLLDDLNQQSLRLLPGKNIEFVKQIRYDGDIDVDPPRFLRVLCNVIKNACQAMPAGGILTITTDLVQDQVVLRISDTGTGIAPDVLPKLFEPFAVQDFSHGAGLSLAVAKAVVEAHNGKISIASISGKGTTVEIRLPKPSAE